MTDDFNPNTGDQSYNGYKVFLSSPRHSDSRYRGECLNAGREENVNGRRWNWHAGNGSQYLGEPTTSTIRNIHSRGYKVRLSQNKRDDGYINNIVESQNYSANLHIVTHTNATSGCDTSNNYMLTMWEDDVGTYDDKNLALSIDQWVGLHVYGPDQIQQRTNLAELDRNASDGDVYVELQFHDNQTTQSWIDNNTAGYASAYGLAVDAYLNYP
ncbi:MAG: hypothetical protein ACRCYU_09005 [Nocardioides sp.]